MKKLVVFCDGTWNKVDETSAGVPCPTNVVRLFEATLSHDAKGNPQVVHYIQGIGTHYWDRLRGGGFGYGISDNIKDAYRFIVSNYEPGDEIFLFGFSRGAYTARSIAGLIHNMGILKREYFYQVNDAYKNYKDRSADWHPDGPKTKGFRQAYTWGNETIRFVGVWDTVGALGAPYGIVLGWIIDKLFNTRFHDIKLSSSIESACHALAIDERRWPFRPTLWQLSSTHDPANFEEKWFPGAHSDVGGGYPEMGLSDTALEWMADKAGHHGLQVDMQRISNPAFRPDFTEAPHDSQFFLIRWATLLFIKLPSYIGLITRENKPLVQYIQGNGDYLRPIPNKEDIHPATVLKMNEQPYKPLNA